MHKCYGLWPAIVVMLSAALLEATGLNLNGYVIVGRVGGGIVFTLHSQYDMMTYLFDNTSQHHF